MRRRRLKLDREVLTRTSGIEGVRGGTTWGCTPAITLLVSELVTRFFDGDGDPPPPPPPDFPQSVYTGITIGWLPGCDSDAQC